MAPYHLHRHRHRHRARLVLFPCPLQGHINPMLQLAALLHTQGFSITILIIDSGNPGDYPDFTFIPIPVELEPTDDLTQHIITLNAKVYEPLRNQLEKMVEVGGRKGEEEEVVPVCLISDAIMYSAKAAADRAGLPMIVLRTGSAACFNVFVAVPMLWSKGYYPLQGAHATVFFLSRICYTTGLGAAECLPAST